MKKLLTLIVLVAACFSMEAQTIMGVKAGANFSNFAMSQQLKDNFNSNLSTGYQVGAFVEIPFGGMFAVSAEAFYTRRGESSRSKIDFAAIVDGNIVDQGPLKSVTDLNYLDIPLMLKYNLRGRTVSSYIMAGPQIGFGLSGRIRNRVIEGQSQDWVFDDVRLELGTGRNDDVKPTDFGIAIGAGLKFELDMGYIFVDARYYMGMTNLANSSNPADAFRNRTLMLNVGYGFPLGGY